MDFLQTFFLDKYFFIAHTRENILEINKARNWHKHIAPYYRFLLPKDFDAKTPEIDANESNLSMDVLSHDYQVWKTISLCSII